MSALIAHKLVKAPLMAAIRPSASLFRFNSTSTSTSVTEAREPVALQAEIVSGAPGWIRDQVIKQQNMAHLDYSSKPKNAPLTQTGSAERDSKPPEYRNAYSYTAARGNAGMQAILANISYSDSKEVRMHPCRIFQQAKGATQSGIVNTGNWRLDFDTELGAGRFENELMGWASSSDYMQALQMKFNTKEDAIAFADKQGWDFTIQEPNKKIFKKKVYADNFKYSPKKLRFVKTK
ncbi:hypothetical protein BGZ59_003572 [Podila verticillata]|nr:hypothetical protein BGZ59_003572 [Podila verticillata]